MSRPRPLRAVFDELAGADPAGAGPAGARPAGARPADPAGARPADPAGALAAGGHGDLPGELVAEAIVSYAGTAPVEVAEHLSRFVTAHSAVPLDGPAGPLPDPAAGLDLLATAPAGPLPDDPAPATGSGDQAPVREEEPQFGAGAGDRSSAAPAGPDSDPYDLDFGGGPAGIDPEPGYPDLATPEPELTDGFAAAPPPLPGPDPDQPPGEEDAGGLAG